MIKKALYFLISFFLFGCASHPTLYSLLRKERRLLTSRAHTIALQESEGLRLLSIREDMCQSTKITKDIIIRKSQTLRACLSLSIKKRRGSTGQTTSLRTVKFSLSVQFLL